MVRFFPPNPHQICTRPFGRRKKGRQLKPTTRQSLGSSRRIPVASRLAPAGPNLIELGEAPSHPSALRKRRRAHWGRSAVQVMARQSKRRKGKTALVRPKEADEISQRESSIR
ncbi:hypothetical protein GW17_00009064 [Ensete ventricosum]|nr:hypothetical protein GW17_00009064 [Ensete ventricosum]